MANSTSNPKPGVKASGGSGFFGSEALKAAQNFKAATERQNAAEKAEADELLRENEEIRNFVGQLDQTVAETKRRAAQQQQRNQKRMAELGFSVKGPDTAGDGDTGNEGTEPSSPTPTPDPPIPTAPTPQEDDGDTDGTDLDVDAAKAAAVTRYTDLGLPQQLAESIVEVSPTRAEHDHLSGRVSRVESSVQELKTKVGDSRTPKKSWGKRLWNLLDASYDKDNPPKHP